MIRILNAEPSDYSPEALRILQSIGEVREGQFTRSELIRELGDYDILIVRLGFEIDREVINAGGRLKGVVSATTGMDHIDVEYAQERGVQVLCLKGETEFLRSIPATSEHTWGLLLALVRHIPQAHNAVLKGSWNREDFVGHELSGKALGLLGVGRIGEKIARFGNAFGMRVGGYDPYREPWLPGVTRHTSLRSLLESSGILTIHLPLNPETQNLIGNVELGWLPRGSLLVNTSRGEIIDENALSAALESGHLGGAALDVIRDERNEQSRLKSPILKLARTHPNLIITPHIGGATFESMRATELFMANKLARFLHENPNSGK